MDCVKIGPGGTVVPISGSLDAGYIIGTCIGKATNF